MLPHIHPKHRHIRPSHRVLVLSRSDLETTLGAARADKPAPATTLNAKQSGTKGIDKGLLRAPAGHDGLLQRGSGAREVIPGGSGRGEVLPEEAVVDVTTAVETDLLLQANQGGHVVGLGGRGVGGERGIEVVDVGLVMLLVVQLHDLLGDHGLEGLERSVWDRHGLVGSIHTS